MKQLIIVSLCIFGAFINMQGHAEEKKNDQIIETKTHSVFEGLFFKVWEKLKSINPTQKQSAKTAQIYTAGIRGAENTDTLLKPYWKNDLTQDEAFQEELAAFSKAQLKLDKGDLNNAIKDFDSFISKYDKSTLRPNALFARSISFAGVGDNAKSVSSMKLFIEENPNHPLIEDAKQIVSELSG